MTRNSARSAASVFCFLAAMAPAATAQAVYNSIPSPLPGNVDSEGPEAHAFVELGDGLKAHRAGGTLGQVKVVLSSWACQSGGGWNSANCTTIPGATFNQPITINVYAAATSGSGSGPLASITQTFTIPYRPSVDPVHCYSGSPSGGDGTQWYSEADKACYHGVATTVAADFSNFHLALPDAIVVTVAFNSSHHGPNPIGESAACYSTSAGCPYDALNISTHGSPHVGANIDADGIFVNHSNSELVCDPSLPTGALALDTGCRKGYHPEIEVDVTPAAGARHAAR